MVFHHFLVQLYILNKFWPEKIIFLFFCEFESSGNSVMHCKGGTLPKKRWISKDVWNTFLLWFWMRFGDHRALYHVPIVIIPTLKLRISDWAELLLKSRKLITVLYLNFFKGKKGRVLINRGIYISTADTTTIGPRWVVILCKITQYSTRYQDCRCWIEYCIVWFYTK